MRLKSLLTASYDGWLCVHPTLAVSERTPSILFTINLETTRMSFVNIGYGTELNAEIPVSVIG